MEPATQDRHADNRSDARLLAEDAADLCHRTHWTMETIALAQAKALASIAINLAFMEQGIIEFKQRERQAAIRRADALAWASWSPAEEARREYEQEIANS
jgi:hypothetical protein